MKKIVFSTVALAAFLGNSFATDYIIDADGPLPPPPTYLDLEAVRTLLGSDVTESYSKFLFLSLGEDASHNLITTDASVTGSFYLDFDLTGGSPYPNNDGGVLCLSSQIGLPDPITGQYTPLTISPAAGYGDEAFVRLQVADPGKAGFISNVYVPTYETVIFSGFANSVFDFYNDGIGNNGTSHMGVDAVHQGTMRFENNTALLPNAGGAAVRGRSILRIRCSTFEYVGNKSTYGGAIDCGGTIEMGSGVHIFDKNWAIAGESTSDKAGNGGAIFTHSVSMMVAGEAWRNSFTDAWAFTENLASNKGGAIFAFGGVTIFANLSEGKSGRPAGSEPGHLIEFKGNRDGVIFTPDGFGGFTPDYTYAKANAIHMDGQWDRAFFTATTGADRIYFYDPITTTSERARVKADPENPGQNIPDYDYFYTTINGHQYEYSYQGKVFFDGSYWSNLPGHTVTADDLTSKIYGNTKVDSGWMFVQGGAIFDVKQSNGVVDNVIVGVGGGDFKIGGTIESQKHDMGGALYIAAGSHVEVAGKISTELNRHNSYEPAFATGGSLWFGIDDNAVSDDPMLTASSLSLWDNTIYLDLSNVDDNTSLCQWVLFNIDNNNFSLSSDVIVLVTFAGINWTEWDKLYGTNVEFNKAWLNLASQQDGFNWDSAQNAWICNREDIDRIWKLTPDGTLSVIPEPTTWALLGLSGLAVVLFRRKKS